MSKHAVMPLVDYVNACNAMREKTGTTDVIKSGDIPDKVAEVYNKGQLATLKNSQYMNGKESGTIVSVNDVTPIEHNVGVKVASKNLFDKLWLKTVNVLNGVAGSVAFDGDIITYTYTTESTAKRVQMLLPKEWFNEGEQYTISLDCSIVPNIMVGTASSISDTSSFNKLGKFNSINYGTFTAKDLDKDYVNVYVYLPTLAVGDTATISNIQLELGDTATEYTPYISVNRNLLLATDFYKMADNYSQLVEDNRNCMRFTDNKAFKYEGLTFEENTQYTVSFWCKTVEKSGGGDASSRFFVFYYTNGTKSIIAQTATSGEWVYRSFTSDAGKTISYIGMDSVNYKNWLYVDIDTFQLEKGSAATPYVPYGTNFTNMRGVSKNLCSDIYTEYADTGYKSKYIADAPLIMSLTDKDTSVDVSGCYFGWAVDPDNVNDGYRWVVNNGTVEAKKTNTSISGEIQCPYLIMYPSGEATFNKIMQRWNIQVEYGTTATPYEPYIIPATVRRCGANLFPFGESVTIQGHFINGTSNAFIPAQTNVEFLRGKTIRYSAYFDLSGAVEDTATASVRATCYDANGASLGINFGSVLKKADGIMQGYSVVGIKVPESTEQIRFDISIFFNGTETPDPNAFVIVSKGMVTLGDTAREYEPYTETIYTANADGTVEGVKSISPNMTLIPNNNAVTVECEYLRDIDLYIDNLITNVALTGGE